MPRPDGTTLVLVVDDEQLVADTLVRILNENGFDARAVYCGETGVMLARALKPDVLVSDVLMKGMSGVELAIRVSNEMPDCRVVLFSDPATPDLLRNAEAMGHHFEIFKKPVNPEELLDYLKRAR